MSLDVTSLSISVKSDGIQQAATSLEALSVAATKVEGKAKTIKDATSGLSSSQANAVASVEKLIAKFQQQADLLGANTSQMNAYQVAMKNGTQLEQAMAAMLGAEVDAYKAKGIAQQQAIADNKALDDSYKKLQADADAYYAAQAKAQAAGNALNAAGVQANEYRKLSEAQAEAIKMNNALDASNKRLENDHTRAIVEDKTRAYKLLGTVQSEAIKINNELDSAQKRLADDHGKAIIEDKVRAYNALSVAQAEAIKMNNALDASIRKLDQEEAARKQAVFNQTLQQGHDLARGLSGSLGMLWLTYGNIGMMLAGVAIGASLKEAVTGFAAVEYQMTFVKALAEDTTHSVAELTARMHDVAGALGINPESAAKGLRALTQAGLDTTDALATLPIAFKLATVGELALEAAALSATGVMNAYDLKVKDLEHIGDVMAKAGAMSAASVDSISVSMKYSAGTAQQYGVELEKLGTILTLLGKRGITGSSAGVAANNLITEIYSPSSQKAIKAAAALGVKAYADGVRQSLEDTIGSIKDGLAKYDTQSQGILLEAMFGKKGGKAFYAVAQGTKEDFQAMEKQLVDSTGFVAEVYKANLQTVQGQVALTKSAITNMFAKVGEESAQPIKDLMVSIRTLANNQAVQDMFVGLTQSIKTFVTTIVPAAAVIGSFFLAAKVGTAVVTAWAGAMAFVESAITVGLIPAIKALNITMMASPVGLLIGLVTTLGAAYFLLKRNKESVHDLHQKDMDQAAETLKAGEEEIKMLQRQLELRNRGIRGDSESSQLKAMQAQDAVQQIQQRILDNNTKYYTELGKAKNSSNFNAGGPSENIQLEKDLAEAQKTYAALDAQSKKILDLKQRIKTENDRMDAADLASASKAISGTLHYGSDKGAKAAEADAYQKELQSYQNQITAAKKQLEQEKANAQSAYNQGLIGEKGLIEANYTAEVTAANASKQSIQNKINAAQGAENKLAAIEKYKGDIATQNSAIDAAEAERKNKYAELEVSQQQKIQKSAQDKYIAEGNFSKAYEEEFSRKHDLQIARVKSDMASEVDLVKKAEDEKLLAILDTEYAAGKEAADNKTAMASFMELANSTRNALKGVQTATEGQGLAAMFDAASAASATLSARMDDLRTRMGSLTDKKLINEAAAQLTNLGESQRKLWLGVGDSISKSLKDAFGKGGQAASDLIKVAQNYANLENKSGSARIKSYGDAASAAKGFFNQGTTGYQLMADAEKAFRLLELAGMAKSLAATISTSAAKAVAWIPAVFMSFMASLGPYGTVAAGVAIAAVLGGAFGGGGSAPDSSATRQATQGTGTVLGMPDAKSASIVNSLAIIEKNSGLGLAHDNTMIGYLKTVADNISKFATLIVKTTGITGNTGGDTQGFAASFTEGIGATLTGTKILDALTNGFFSKISGKISNSIFGGNTTVLDTGFTTNRSSLGSVMSNGISASQYTDTKTDGGWFSSDKYNTQLNSLGADANYQFAKVITGMANSITAAAKVLGVGGDAFTQHLQSFVVDLGKISLKGLTSDQIQSEIEAAFSKMGDDMAKFAITGLDQFTKVGEGYLETLMRVTNDLIQVKDVFAVLGQSFTLTGTAAVSVSESLITAAGSLDALTSGTQYFVDNFMTEAQKMGPITDSVNQQMAALGLSGITTQDAFTKLVMSLDLTNAPSQQLYVQLLALAPSFKAATDYATALADGTVTLTAAQQKALDAVTKAKTNLQNSYNAESSALQSTIDKTNSFITTLKSYQESLKLGADSPLTNMQKYAEAKKQFEDTVAAAQGGDQAAMDQFTTVSSALLAASKVVNASGDAYTNDFNMVQQMSDSLVSSSTSQVDVATASLDALNKQVQGLLDINASVLSVTQAITELQQAITLGGAAGLSNTQMGTTYTPTPAQVTAATPTQSTANGTITGGGGGSSWFGDAIQGLTDQVAGLRQDQSAQTGAIVSATVDSNAANADDTVASLGMLGTLITSVQKKVTLV